MSHVQLIAESRANRHNHNIADYIGQFKAVTQQDAELLANVIPHRVTKTAKNPSGTHHWSYPDALSDVLMDLGFNVTIHCHSGLVMVNGEYQE